MGVVVAVAVGTVVKFKSVDACSVSLTRSLIAAYGSKFARPVSPAKVLTPWSLAYKLPALGLTRRFAKGNGGSYTARQQVKDALPLRVIGTA